VRPHLYLGLKPYSSVLTIDIPLAVMAVIFALTVWKSYKSCTLLCLMSIARILTGLCLVRTMQGTTTIIQVLIRDGQYFSTASHQVLVLNTFDSPGILYYAGEQSWLTSGSWFPDSNHSQSSHHLFVCRNSRCFFLGANIHHSYVAVCLLNILLWSIDPFASFLGVQLMKTLQVSMCSR